MQTENLFRKVDADGDGFLSQSEVQNFEDSQNLVDEWDDLVQLDDNGKLMRQRGGGDTHVTYGKVLSQLHSKVIIYFRGGHWRIKRVGDVRPWRPLFHASSVAR